MAAVQLKAAPVDSIERPHRYPRPKALPELLQRSGPTRLDVATETA